MKTKRDLFSNDIFFSMPNMQKKEQFTVDKSGRWYRLKNGRFASRSDAFIDKYSRRMQWLTFEREKYMRAWLAVCERLANVERENLRLKNIINKINNKK